MSADDDLFNEIANAKPIGKFAERLGIGKHRVVLKRFAIKKSESEYGRILEADFLVLESTTHEPMSTKGWAWFVESKGWAGKYEQDRVKDFITACGSCVGDDRGVAEIGAGMKGDKQTGRGLMLDVEVTPQTKKGEVKKNPADGSIYVNVEWKAVLQSLEQVAQYRKELDILDGPAQATAAAEPAPAPAAAAPAPAAAKLFTPPPAGTSLLGRR